MGSEEEAAFLRLEKLLSTPAEETLIYSWGARSIRSIPSIGCCRQCISGRDWRHLVSPFFWQKWTTNSQHFQDSHSMPAQLQPDPKRSVSHHLRLEQIHPELKWEKVHFGDGPPAFSGHVWAEKADSCPHGKPFYLDGLCFFDNSTTPSSTARRRNTPMLMSSIDCLSVMIPISTETKERKESSQDPALTKVMRFTREGWPEKKDADDPAEKFRKIANSLEYSDVERQLLCDQVIRDTVSEEGKVRFWSPLFGRGRKNNTRSFRIMFWCSRFFARVAFPCKFDLLTICAEISTERLCTSRFLDMEKQVVF